MLAACIGGRLSVARWLFAMGATDVFMTYFFWQHYEFPSRTTDARFEDHLLVAQWLIEVGAINCSQTHHVDVELITRGFCYDKKKWSPLRFACIRRINENSNFINTVILATRSADTATYNTVSKRAVPSLSLLRGFEGSILKLIADFAGIPYGRPLRNLREVCHALRNGL